MNFFSILPIFGFVFNHSPNNGNILPFVAPFHFELREFSPTTLQSTVLPTIEELSSDPFMKQLNHGNIIVSMFEEKDNSELLSSMISAQLSHSDGIRGFMVSYLTGEGPLDDLPETLTESMEQLENKEELISLACMNVIMPTAMVTLHKDEELSNSSKMTASKGKKVAGVLMKYDEMKAQCDAICAVAKEQATESSNINKYWIDFFEKWGYGSEQKRDIALAMVELLGE